MHNKNSTELEPDETRKNDDSKGEKGPSELFVGSVTFAVFIVFMTVWMYFSG